LTRNLIAFGITNLNISFQHLIIYDDDDDDDDNNYNDDDSGDDDDDRVLCMYLYTMEWMYTTLYMVPI